MSSETFNILNRTKHALPRLPFLQIKNEVLGEKYDLSLVFCGSTLSRRLNRERRDKDKPANILSFPLSDTTGEIFIDIGHASKQAHLFERTPEKFLAFLVIHGLHHLKGMEHGSTMELREENVRKKFHI